jgi:hypothetical protein
MPRLQNSDLDQYLSQPQIPEKIKMNMLVYSHSTELHFLILVSKKLQLQGELQRVQKNMLLKQIPFLPPPPKPPHLTLVPLLPPPLPSTNPNLVVLVGTLEPTKTVLPTSENFQEKENCMTLLSTTSAFGNILSLLWQIEAK